MEIIRPVALEIAYSIESGESSSYPYYGAQSDYDRYDRVFSDPDQLIDGGYGDGHNYKLLCYDWDLGDGRPEDYPSCWEDLGVDYYEIASYTTAASYDEYAAWSSGSAVSAGQTVYYNTRNYEALVTIAGGDNTTNPESAIASLDNDIAARWADRGPANAFACVDDEAATVTTHVGSWTMTVIASGECDRIGLWAMSNIASVGITVTAAEIIPNWNFESSAITGWYALSATLTWSASEWVTITNTTFASTTGGMYRKLENLTVGRTYSVKTTVTAGGGDTWYLEIRESDNTTSISSGSASPQTGSQTDHERTFEATETTHFVWVICAVGTEDITVTYVSVKDDDFAGDTASDTLKDSTTGICIRNTLLTHDPVSYAQYAITYTATTDQSTTGVGLISAGKAITIGCTHANVEVGGISGSRIIDDEYLDVRIKRRRRARTFTATVQLNSLSGDLLDQLLTELEGVNASFDFNSGGSTSSRLQIHGWPESWSTVVTGWGTTNDTMQISMRSLVEAVYG